MIVFVFFAWKKPYLGENFDSQKIEISTLTYSNLADENSQNIVKNALLRAGISEKNSENFLQNVNFFNNSIEKTSLNNGFVTLKSSFPEYDFEKIQLLWNQKNPDFIGINCRLTNFGFFSDLIVTNATESLDVTNLLFDKKALEFWPKNQQKPENVENFENFYAKIDTPKTKNLETHIQNVKNAFTKRNIQFFTTKNPQKASIISVFFHFQENSESYLFIGHTGLLIPEENGFLFVEKLAFQEPYQAVKFSDKNALIAYLMKKYDVD